MFDSSVVGIAVALAAVYLFLSMAVSHVAEVFAALLARRSTHLERALGDLLAHPDIASAVLRDPLISSLAVPRFRKVGPSYIPADTFADAILAYLPKQAPVVGAPQAPPAVDWEAARSRLLGTVSGVTTEVDKLRQVAANAGKTVEGLRREAVAASPALGKEVDALVARLQRLEDAALSKATTLRKEIEGWFDDAMDRWQGLYKRNTQQIIFVIGLLLVAVTNSDTIEIADQLWSQPAVRQSMTQVAQHATEACLAAAAATPASPASPPGSEKPKEPPASPDLAKCKGLAATLQVPGLPLAWRGGVPSGGEAWALKIFGFVLSALAVSLGAPFWFDLLKRIAPGAAKLTGKAPTS